MGQGRLCWYVFMVLQPTSYISELQYVVICILALLQGHSAGIFAADKCSNGGAKALCDSILEVCTMHVCSISCRLTDTVQRGWLACSHMVGQGRGGRWGYHANSTIRQLYSGQMKQWQNNPGLHEHDTNTQITQNATERKGLQIYHKKE